jgi:hypothetical protein
MTEFPEIEALRRFDIYANHGDCNCEPDEALDGEWVRTADAEQAVRDAVERQRIAADKAFARASAIIREQAVRECVEALREEADRRAAAHVLIGDACLRDAGDFLERTMLGGEDAR